MSFPDNPVTGQLHTIGTTEWRWDGEKWIIKGSGVTISDVYTDEVGLVQEAKVIEDLYNKVLEPLDKPLFRSQEGVNIALSEIIDNLKSDDVEVKTPEVLLENDESLVADLYQKILDTTTRPLLGTQESVNIAFTEIIDNLKSDDVEVKTPEVLLDNDESVVADLYQKILDTTTRPLLGTQESVNIAFTEIIDNLKSDDVEVSTPDVKLNDDESVVADLYQKVLETVTPPVLGNQESVNIAFTEIIDNLKSDDVEVSTPDVKLNDDEFVVGNLYRRVLETLRAPILGNQESVNIAFTEIIDNLKIVDFVSEDPVVIENDPYDPGISMIKLDLTSLPRISKP